MKNLAMAIVVKDKTVLIQRRFRYQKGMVYEFPGGSVDDGETGQQAAIRELREETGIEAANILGVHVAKNTFGGDIYYVIVSASDHQEPVAIDSERQQTFYWLTVGEIPLKDFFEADRAFIQQHLKNFT